MKKLLLVFLSLSAFNVMAQDQKQQFCQAMKRAEDVFNAHGDQYVQYYTRSYEHHDYYTAFSRFRTLANCLDGNPSLEQSVMYAAYGNRMAFVSAKDVEEEQAFMTGGKFEEIVRYIASAPFISYQEEQTILKTIAAANNYVAALDWFARKVGAFAYNPVIQDEIATIDRRASSDRIIMSCQRRQLDDCREIWAFSEINGKKKLINRLGIPSKEMRKEVNKVLKRHDKVFYNMTKRLGAFFYASLLEEKLRYIAPVTLPVTAALLVPISLLETLEFALTPKSYTVVDRSLDGKDRRLGRKRFEKVKSLLENAVFNPVRF